MTSTQPTKPTDTESRDAGFRAVSGGPELASGTTLLVEAYAAIWILLLVMIALTWRRLAKLETRISDLEQTARDRTPGAAEHPAPEAAANAGAKVT